MFAKHAAVAVTRGLLSLMPRDQVKGVLAHEMSHVRNHDILVTSIAATLRGHPTANARIEGFTDNSGDPDHNRKLSTDRASAVRDALTRQGVDPDRLTIAGNSPASPVAASSGESVTRYVSIAPMASRAPA